MYMMFKALNFIYIRDPYFVTSPQASKILGPSLCGVPHRLKSERLIKVHMDDFNSTISKHFI